MCVSEFGCKYDVCIYSNATPNTLALGLTPCLCILSKNVGMCGLTPCLVANILYDERYKCLRTLGGNAEPHSERLNLGFTRCLRTQVPQERCYLTYNRKPQCKLIFRGGVDCICHPQCKREFTDNYLLPDNNQVLIGQSNVNSKDIKLHLDT